MRVLLVGGGCRGLDLARALVADGHAVRAVTRSEAHRPAIEAAGAECWIGDPDVIGTLRYALENVTILVWALGTASGAPHAVAALHGPRLHMMLSKTIDTTVRGVVYEAGRGREMVERMTAYNEIPVRVLEHGAPDWDRAVRDERARQLQAAAAAADEQDPH